jgi:hypothetical protein
MDIRIRIIGLSSLRRRGTSMPFIAAGSKTKEGDPGKLENWNRNGGGGLSNCFSRRGV